MGLLIILLALLLLSFFMASALVNGVYKDRKGFVMPSRDTDLIMPVLMCVGVVCVIVIFVFGFML